jgi:toxin ParE1/3/4
LHIVIQPRAASDIEIATKYYLQEASHEVAERFLNEFRYACDLIAEHPNIGSLRFARLLPNKNLRFWSFDRFPFRIFYLINIDTIQIIAVDHERRNLKKKFEL